MIWSNEKNCKISSINCFFVFIYIRWFLLNWLLPIVSMIFIVSQWSKTMKLFSVLAKKKWKEKVFDAHTLKCYVKLITWVVFHDQRELLLIQQHKWKRVSFNISVYHFDVLVKCVACRVCLLYVCFFWSLCITLRKLIRLRFCFVSLALFFICFLFLSLVYVFSCLLFAHFSLSLVYYSNIYTRNRTNV